MAGSFAPERLSRAVPWIAGLAATLAALGFAGHFLEVRLLDQVVPNRPRMMPTTAALLMIGAAGIGLRHREPVEPARRASATLLGLLMLLTSAVICLEYLLDVWLVDWLHAREVSLLPHAGRPSFVSAVGLFALGGALLLFDLQPARFFVPREWLCLTVVFVAFVSLVGHAFGAGELYEVKGSRIVGVALPTAAALLLLGLAGLFARPQTGVMQLVTSQGPGGVLLRRLGLIATLGGPVLGALALLLFELTGLADLALILATETVFTVFFALVLLVATALPIERAYAAAQAGHARVQELLDQAPEGVFVADLEGRYTEVNVAGCRLLGYAREELLGKQITDLLAEADQPRLWQSRAKLLAGDVDAAEWSLRRKDGSFVCVEVTAKILPGGQWQAFVRDISERRALERERERHLAQQELLARVGVELASCLERDETLQRVVALAIDALGDIASIDVVAGDDMRRAHVGARGQASTADAVRRVGASHGETHPLTIVLETKRPLLLSHITPEDRRRYATSEEHARVLDAVDATSAMLVPLIARGQLLAVLSIAATRGSRTYTASDLLLAEQLAHRAALTLDNVQLFQQSRLLAAITANLGEGVALVRTSDFSIVYSNRALQAMLGYEPVELSGMRAQMLLAEGAEPLEQAPKITAALEHSGAWHGEVKHRHKDGRELWCAVAVSSFDHEEHGKVFIVVTKDISEQKALEERNARSLRDKEVLLREIHHRVKNNLQVVSSLFSLQRDRTDSAELKGLLEESQTRVQSIALVHEQLYLASDLAAIDLDAYLRALVGAIRTSYGAARIAFETSAQDVVLDVEQAVPCALLTCELVSNAIKHAFDGGPGTVRVRARRDDEGQCKLEVSDDGRGMPPDLDWRHARSLGLRLVLALLRQLRGTIELDRTNGTCFRVRFPLRESRDIGLQEVGGDRRVARAAAGRV